MSLGSGVGMTHGISSGMTVAVAGLWAPTLLPRFHDDPWSHRAPEDEEALLAAEELAWDNKMNALRQSMVTGPSPGNMVVEHTEDEHEMEDESASDDMMDQHRGNDTSQALDWDDGDDYMT